MPGFVVSASVEPSRQRIPLSLHWMLGATMQHTKQPVGHRVRLSLIDGLLYGLGFRIVGSAWIAAQAARRHAGACHRKLTHRRGKDRKPLYEKRGKRKTVGTHLVGHQVHSNLLSLAKTLVPTTKIIPRETIRDTSGHMASRTRHNSLALTI